MTEGEEGKRKNTPTKEYENPLQNRALQIYLVLSRLRYPLDGPCLLLSNASAQSRVEGGPSPLSNVRKKICQNLFNDAHEPKKATLPFSCLAYLLKLMCIREISLFIFFFLFSGGFFLQRALGTKRLRECVSFICWGISFGERLQQNNWGKYIS